MKKRFLTWLLSVIFVVMMVVAVMMPISVSAKSYIKNPSSANGSNYTNSSSLASMLNTVFAGDIDIYSNSACSKEVSMPIGTNMSNSTQYYVKSKTTGNNVTGWQCYIYANAVYNKLFNEWVGHGSSFSHSEVVISGGSNTATYEMFKNAGVRCGAYMRTTGNKDGSYSSNVAHSLIILSYDSTSINYLEGNGDGNGAVRIANMTWSEFNSGQLSGRSRYICHVVQPTATYYNSLYPDNAQERDPKLVSWVSTKGQGYNVEEATKTTSGTTQTRYYYWFKIYDGNTGDLLNSWDSKDYTATMNIYYSDGSLVVSYSYQKSDANWISWVPSKADTYKCEIVLSGGWNGTHTTSFTVSSNSYAVTYNANGGSNAPSSQTKYYGTNLTLSTAQPTRTGYTFLGWATSSGASSPTYYPGSTYSANSNVTLYAVWRVNSYCITYNANGGSFSLASQYKDHGETVTLSTSNPTRAGYTFEGWATSSTATTPSYYPGSLYSGNANITLYAVWSRDTYNVTYNANGGSNAPSSQTKYYGTNLTLSSVTPTRSGYTFLGWATSSSASTASYHAGSTYSNNASVTFYAVWSKNTYTITYNANGGSNPPSIQTKYYDTSITLSAGVPNKEGYTFEGWATSSTATTPSYYPGSSYNGNANITLYAVWVKMHVTKPTAEIYSSNYFDTVQYARIHLFADELADELNEGWIKGYYWGTDPVYTNNKYVDLMYGDEDFQNGYTETSEPIGCEGTYYLVVEDTSGNLSDTYSITYYQTIFHTDGREFSPAYVFTADGKSFSLPTLEDEGYTFLGWSENEDAVTADYQSGYTYTPNGFKILYAVWNANEYTVSYDANDGSNVPESQIKTHGTELTLSATIPYREGYTFVGWATSSDATDAGYEVGGTYTADESTTLYAVWKVNTYTVTYNANDGSNVPESQIKTHGTELTLSATIPHREGYTFVGWATSSDATDAGYEAGGTYTADESTTLYAVWKVNTYTVTYNANGGSNVSESQIKTHGMDLTLSATIPDREGYTFVGWATSSDATDASYEAGGTYAADESITLYAVWEIIIHTHVFDQQNTNDQYKAGNATCQNKDTYYYSCSCGEKGAELFEYGTYKEHSFSNYVSNDDATYLQDGTKTGKCLHCNKIDIIRDVGSALGLKQKFSDEFLLLTKDADTETVYAELYALLQTYASLSEEEKNNVATEFEIVQQKIKDYNTQAKSANDEHADATETAFAPLAATNFTFLSLLWFLLKKKFWI